VGDVVDSLQKAILREINTDGTILDTVLVYKFTPNFFEQGKTAGNQNEMDAICG
jgi:hypothetical protein